MSEDDSTPQETSESADGVAPNTPEVDAQEEEVRAAPETPELSEAPSGFLDGIAQALARAKSHSRLLASLLEETQSCPTRDLALSTAADLIRTTLDLDFAMAWSVGQRNRMGIVSAGIDATLWGEAQLEITPLVARALETEEVLFAPTPNAPDNCPIVTACILRESAGVVLVPIFGREGTVLVVTVMAFGTQTQPSEDTMELFRLVGTVLSSGITRIDDQMDLMEANAANEAQVALFDETTRAASPTLLIESALQIVRDKFDWTAALFWERSSPEGPAHPVLFSGPLPPSVREAREKGHCAAGDGWIGRALQTGELDFVREIERSEVGIEAGLVEHGMVSALALPIAPDGQVLGVIELLSDHRVYLGRSRRLALGSIARLVSQSYRRSRELDHQTRSAAQARGLTALVSSLSLTKRSTEAAERALLGLGEAFDVTVGTYWRFTNGKAEFHIARGEEGDALEERLRGRRIELGEGAIGRALEEGSVSFLEADFEQEVLGPALKERELCFHFVLPMIADGEVSGVVTAHAKADRPQLETDVASFQSLAALLGRTVERIRHDRLISRYAPMVENTPTAIGLGDRNGNFVFINRTGLALIGELGEHLPFDEQSVIGFPMREVVAEVIGGADILDPEQLPLRGQLTLGPEVIRATISAIHDHSGYFLGPMLAWDIITEDVHRQRAIEGAQQKERERQAVMQRGVQAVLHTVQQVELGDLTCGVPDCGGGEIAQVADGLDRVLRKLRGSMATIGELARSLDGNAESLSTVAERVDGNAGTTLDSVNSTSLGLREVTGGIHSVSSGSDEMASSVSEIAQHATDAARVGGSAVALAEDAAAKIERLGNSSAQVGLVMRTINTIAEQTKLLALNATIEAARA
ncbi:MAG: GAF domain-containing protein, partial [Myxococcota bacterium]